MEEAGVRSRIAAGGAGTGVEGRGQGSVAELGEVPGPHPRPTATSPGTLSSHSPPGRPLLGHTRSSSAPMLLDVARPGGESGGPRSPSFPAGGLLAPSSASATPGAWQSLDSPGLDAGAHLIALAADAGGVEGSFVGPSPPGGAGAPLSRANSKLGPAGSLSAQVTTAELVVKGGKDYVVYTIQVRDDAGTWTVARRYRNFEVLHRQLKCLPAYKCA